MNYFKTYLSYKNLSCIAITELDCLFQGNLDTVRNHFVKFIDAIMEIHFYVSSE